MLKNWQKCYFKNLIYEHGYSEPISSGREFQFFSAHFIFKSRKDTRVGALYRYTLPTYVKIIEKSCNFFQKSFWGTKLGSFQNPRPGNMANFRNFWAQKFEQKNLRMIQNDLTNMKKVQKGSSIQEKD